MAINMEVAERIKARVREYRAQLESMSRTRILEEFKTTGNEPHPRFSKEWMVAALTRLFQDNLWCTEAGYVPKEIAEANSRFWLSNTVALIRRDAVIHERREERRIEKAKDEDQKPGVAPQSTPCTELKMVFVKGKQNPFSASSRSEGPSHRFFETLKKRKNMDYDDVRRWCARDVAQPEVALIYLSMERMAACEFMKIAPDQESEPVTGLQIGSTCNSLQEPMPIIPDVERGFWIDGINDQTTSNEDQQSNETSRTHEVEDELTNECEDYGHNTE